MRRGFIALLLGAVLLSGCGGGAPSSTQTTSEAAPQNAEESIEGFGEEAQGSNREALLSPDASQIAEGQGQGKIARVRIEGDTAFIVFHAPGARRYQLKLIEEDGRWKAASLSASVLAPSLNH